LRAPAQVTLRIARTRQQAEEWALVLEAEGLSSRLARLPEGFALCVTPQDKEQALTVLAAYESENPSEAQSFEPLRAFHPLGSALTLSATLVVFFSITGPRSPEAAWFARGSADAERILVGELWRVLTALTLHADLAHVLANAIAASLFFAAVFQVLGPGVGLALILVAGATGNLLNAYVHGSGHISVGASTAVFGAVGMLAGLAVARRRRGGVRGRRAWAPIAAGLALLAMLGAGNRADLGAHLFGFLAGCVFGAPVGILVRGMPSGGLQGFFAVLALTLLLGAWHLALR
jgi:membrane associated rhomboid family serine protease